MTIKYIVDEINHAMQNQRLYSAEKDITPKNLVNGRIPIREMDKQNGPSDEDEIVMYVIIGDTLTDTFRYIGLELTPDYMRIPPTELDGIIKLVERFQRMFASE